ncbi:Hypothetical predicted protein [Pelobates cultripes]|uniref:Uncharacterized protein n=1 Tax=Pelobates cultripes TaxID=61616 RepID=A0AAD1R5B4_PELCU|nr:Hypothetical predicted protein [Pelobates cultripes]
MQLLHTYGKVAYYKLNQSKTQALPIGLTHTQVQDLTRTYKFDWRADHITYLGVKIAPTSERMFHYNYKPLLRLCKAECLKWKPVKLSWLGRINTIKMTLLPKLLYVFRLLHIQAPPAFFKQLQRTLSAYIWDSRKPRLFHRLLQQRTAEGGVGLPDIYTYYKAANLETAVKLHTPKGTYQWVDMEAAKSDKMPLVDILWTPKTLRPKDNLLFPTTSLTLHHWDVLRHSQNTTHKFHPRTPLTALRAISPWLSLNSWVKLGIHKLDQIMHHNLIKPFPELQQEFKLTNSSVFPYMQIKSIIPSHVARTTTEINQSTKVVDTLYDRCWHTPTKPKTLALCYQVAMKTAPHYSPPFVTQWLADCNEPITDKEVEASPTALKVAPPTPHRKELHYTGVPAINQLTTQEVVSLPRRNESHTEKQPPRPQALLNTDHTHLRCNRVPPGIIHADCNAEIDTC